MSIDRIKHRYVQIKSLYKLDEMKRNKISELNVIHVARIMGKLQTGQRKFVEFVTAETIQKFQMKRARVLPIRNRHNIRISISYSLKLSISNCPLFQLYDAELIVNSHLLKLIGIIACLVCAWNILISHNKIAQGEIISNLWCPLITSVVRSLLRYYASHSTRRSSHNKNSHYYGKIFNEALDFPAREKNAKGDPAPYRFINF